MEELVVESVRYSARCADCGARLECGGVHGLVGGSLRWDIESVCSACGQATAACGQDLPARLRDQLLADNGPTTLHVTAPSAVRVIVMRVLRAELGVGLTEAKAVADQVLAGAYSGTLPQVEYLARKLRMAGVDAVATRP
ncbi:hypothetical protein [Streptomyces tubercidicus]|uniref:hypothetical protein n=1 Tax=Streptomyces tubercidicus TaxID=47759 RepID=UPI0022B795ED|nr:hypothetical protein [Streptomyces tubercidicus]WAU10038.1 hypothetical protein STRTU_000086 [Streptomyces tubercidicus]